VAGLPDLQDVGVAAEHEEHAERLFGFAGSGAADEMWAAWRQHGAVGEKAETPEQQAKRYAGVEEDSVELQPGLSRHELRDADVIVTCSLDYLVRTWDAKTLALLQTFEGHTNHVNVVEPYHGRWLLSCSDDCSLRLWRRGTEAWGELERTIWCGSFAVKGLCTLPGCRAACSAVDKLVRVVSLRSGEVLHKVYPMTVSENPGALGYWLQAGCGQTWGLLHLRQNLMASCSDDTSLRIWDVDTMRCLGTYVGHEGWGDESGSERFFARNFAPVFRLVHLGGQGGRIASCSFDGSVVVWDVSDAERVLPVQTLRGHSNSVTNLCLLHEGMLLTCSGDGTCKVWDLGEGTCLRTLEQRGQPMCAARLDGRRVAVGGGDCTIRVFDWRTGEELLGEGGVYAHDLCLSWMTRLYETDCEAAEASLWLEPIMYRGTQPLQEWEQIFAPNFEKEMTQQALEIAAHGLWD